MILTTTFKRLRAQSACESSYRKLRKALKGTKDTAPINLLTILEHNGMDDALWALRATAENCDKVARLLASDFANGLIDRDSLAAARTTAWAAAGPTTGTAEWDAARNAAWDAEARTAAWNAARTAQRVLFIRALQPETIVARKDGRK